MKLPSGGVVAPRSAVPRPKAVSAAPQPGGQPFTLSAPAPSVRPQPSLTSGRPTNWLDAVTSQVALAPISMDNMKVVRSKWAPLVDEPSIAGPYKLDRAPSLPAFRADRGKPAGPLTRAYRRAVGHVQNLFRWLNESAYFVSVPFLMCLLLGLAVGNHSLMVLGATGVVVLNIGRIVAGVANLAAIPFRDSPIRGILFLIPPITFIYLAQHWQKVRKPVKRIVGPILTIAFVALAFVAEPWPKGEGKSRGSIQEQAEAGVRSMKKEIGGRLGKIPDLHADGLDKLEQKAGEAIGSLRSSDSFKSLEGKVKEGGKMLGSPGSKVDSNRSP